MPPKGQDERPEPQQERRRFKVRAIRRLAEVETKALERVRLMHEAMIWRRNQRIWLPMHINSEAKTTMEVVTTRGELEVMLKQEMYSLLIQVLWTLKQRACKNMPVRWIRKDTSQLHDFDWEVSLIVPTPGGRRSVSGSASQARGYHHIWFSGMPGILRRFKQVLFRQSDPISGNAVLVVYTYLITQPCIRQYA